MVYAYLFLVIALAHNLFSLFPVIHMPGMFRVSDFGIALIGLGLLYYLLRSRDVRRLLNFFSWYIFLYLLLVGTQASLASFKYSQSILDGLIAGRHQFYYLSFLLFLLALNDTEKIRKFMGALTLAALALIIASIINYFEPTLFYHDKAEEIRAGIVRAFIPGMGILVVTAIWQLSKYVQENRVITPSLWIFLALYGGIIFRQTRGRIIAVAAVVALMLLAHRRFKTLISFCFILLALVSILTLGAEKNLLLNAFETTYTELTQGGGSWKARVYQVETSWDVVRENFWTGSGGLVIRGTPQGWGSLRNVAYAADLGYWVWLKFFGFPGMVLLSLIIFGFYRRVLKATPRGEESQIVLFASYHFTCILISMVTLAYFTSPPGIVMLCLTWAVLVNATQNELGHVATGQTGSSGDNVKGSSIGVKRG